jgi:hypothetical protein
MKKLKTAIAMTVFAALMAIPSQAAAENIVPPGNSAATQYTEVFPTAGGNAAIKNGSIGGGKKGAAEKTLGQATTKALEEHGSEGRAVVELASEGAPAPSPAPEGGEGGASGASGNGGSGEESKGTAAGGASTGQGGGGSGGAGGSHSGGAKAGGQPAASIPAATAAGAQVSGDSGPAAILAQATGSSSGTMGIFLPLLLLVALVWAAAYSWRQRQLKRAAS